MASLPDHIKVLFFRTMKSKEAVPEFAQWLYGTKELEPLLPADDYLDLISLSYKASGSWHELTKLLKKQIDLGEYETWKLKDLLVGVARREGDYVKDIIKFYDLYCDGYCFLDCLAFRYGLPLDSNAYDRPGERLEEATGFYPAIEADIRFVLDLLDSDRIRLTGVSDELGNLQFIDNRTQEEKEVAAYWKTPVADTNAQVPLKKWWHFWD